MSTSSQPAPAYVARTPLDLVAMVPIVLGFHPEDSVVLMTFGSFGGTGSFHARVDLPVEPAHQAEVAEVLAGAVARHRVRQAVVVLYCSDARVASAQCQRVIDVLARQGCGVIETLRVHAGRFFVLPEDGSPGTAYDLSSHAFTAHHVLEGQVVARDRRALADGLRPRDDVPGRADLVAVTLAATRMAQALVSSEGHLGRRLGEEQAWLRRRVRRYVEGGGPIGPNDAGRLLVLASLETTRDSVRDLMGRASPAHVELWRDLVRRAPRDLRPGAAALLSFAAWLRGEGALAWCAIEVAREVDAAHPLAAEVAELLGSAASPREWVPMADP